VTCGLMIVSIARLFAEKIGLARSFPKISPIF
jgi:hypothetical protein